MPLKISIILWQRPDKNLVNKPWAVIDYFEYNIIPTSIIPQLALESPR